VKNKVAPPYKEATVRVRFGRGFDDMFTVKNVLQANKKVSTGAYLYFDKAPELVHPDMEVSKEGKPYIHGEAELMSFADSHPEWRSQAIKLTKELIQVAAQNAAVLEEDDDSGIQSLV